MPMPQTAMESLGNTSAVGRSGRASSSSVTSTAARSVKSLCRTATGLSPASSRASSNAARRSRVCSSSAGPATYATRRWPSSSRWPTASRIASPLLPQAHPGHRRSGVGGAQQHGGQPEAAQQVRTRVVGAGVGQYGAVYTALGDQAFVQRALLGHVGDQVEQ